MPSKGLFRLYVALSEAACWYRHQGSTENALPSLRLMEGQSGSHDDISWVLEDWASKKISTVHGYLATFYTQPITQHSAHTLC